MVDVYRQTSQREAGPGERAQSVSIPHTSMRVGTLVPMIQRKGDVACASVAHTGTEGEHSS